MGYCEIPKEKITCLDVTELIVVKGTAIIRGHARQNGVTTTYEFQAVDSGSNLDTFSVMTGAGFARASAVQGGILTVKAP